MSKKKRKLLSTLAAQVTAMVSVALVLIVIGVMALGGVAAHSFSTMLKERMGFTVVMSDEATAQEIRGLMQSWRHLPYVASVRYMSPEMALERWKEATGDDEDLVALLGSNPFRPEFEVNVRGAYANVDSLRPIIASVAARPGVGEVRMQARMIHHINSAINQIALVLGIVAVALLIISIVLINNMVRLTIYARRFIIHTMKLVGATSAFIRRPFIAASIVNGIIAGAIATVVISGLLVYALSADPALAGLLPWSHTAWVLAGVFLLGIIICGVSALLATNRYLRADYDNLFSR